MNIRKIRQKLNFIQAKLDFDKQRNALETLKLETKGVDADIFKDKSEFQDPYPCHFFTLSIKSAVSLSLTGNNLLITTPIVNDATDVPAFRYLEKQSHIERAESIFDADIVVYLKHVEGDDYHIHSGKVVGEKVLSKWGVGHVWHHGVEHIPSVYEDDGKIRYIFYKIKSPAVIQDLFHS